jgi:two-component system, chemotaxis family, chemotaxis protein CheY
MRLCRLKRLCDLHRHGMLQLLLVDDSRTVRLAARRMLAQDGVELLEAEHGGQALDLLARHPSVAAVLLDWFMPVMDGLALLKAVRGNSRGPQPKILMCTRQDDPARIAEALDHGADEYIVKPFNEAILRSKLALAGLPRLGRRMTL